MKTLFFALSMFVAMIAEARCEFEGMSLGEVGESSDYELKNLGAVPFPQSLISAQGALLGDLSPQLCQSSFIAEQIKVKSSEDIYTAYYSNEDDCDGGNVFGVLVRGTQPHPEQAVATIEDSDFWCL